MDLTDYLKIAINSLASNKFRTFLTTLGIIIGVMSVVALVGIGRAAQNSIETSFSSFGANNIYLTPGSAEAGFNPDSVISSAFTKDQIDAFYDHPKRYITGVATLMNGNYNLKSEYGDESTVLVAYYGDYVDVFNVEIDRGNVFDKADAQKRSKVAILGPEIAQDLFPNGVDPIGKQIQIGDVKFTIIAITVVKGGSSFDNPDRYVSIPYETFRQYLVSSDAFTNITVRTDDQRVADLAKEEATEIMRKVRDIGINEEDDFTVNDAGEILATIQQFTGTLTAFLALVAAISLLVGGIGVMNIMFVSITERTKEIGLRKSLGARNSDILIQFLTESIVVTLIGGIMGIGIGILVSQVVSNLVNLDFKLEIDPILLGIGFSIFIGLVFGIYPARKASKLSPIDALRYE